MSLKIQNHNLAEIVKKKEEERKLFEDKNRKLLDRNNELAKQLTGQLIVQGARNLFWEMIIAEATKIRSYLNFIKDKEMVINAARQSCVAVIEALERKSADTARNTINFLNTLSEEELRIMGIKDMITMIIWARKVVGKH